MRTSIQSALGWPRLLFATWILAASALPLFLAWLRSQAPAAAALALALIGLLGAVTVLASLRALKPVMALVTLALAPLALKWLLRVGFVVQQGGMDCVRCQGSPLLFAWYWAIETAILLPGLLLLGWLVVLLLPQSEG